MMSVISKVGWNFLALMTSQDFQDFVFMKHSITSGRSAGIALLVAGCLFGATALLVFFRFLASLRTKHSSAGVETYEPKKSLEDNHLSVENIRGEAVVEDAEPVMKVTPTQRALIVFG